MEKIKLITKNRFTTCKNPFDEISLDYINNNTFIFEKGRIYGIVCEHGGGGEFISSILSSRIECLQEKIYIDNREVSFYDIQKISWYVGDSVYSKGRIKREISVRKALDYSIKKHQRYKNINEIINEFHLTPGRLNYSISKYSWERWRASLAIGYASNRKVYCFPWMNTLLFYDCMRNSSVYTFFNKFKDEGSIIILPTSRHENLEGLVDEIIEISDSRFETVISNYEHFYEYF